MTDQRKKPDKKREEELDSTQTDLTPGGTTPEGPPIELPKPQEQLPLELGPSHEVDASDDTNTDVLRVAEFSAADADEPVSQPPAAPDPASGTQPSLFSEEDTHTEVCHPSDAPTRAEDVVDERHPAPDTKTEYRPFEEPAGQPEGADGPPLTGSQTHTELGSFAEEKPEVDGPPPTGSQTHTELGSLAEEKPEDPDQTEDASESGKPSPAFSVHEAETEELEEAGHEWPADDLTRTDFEPERAPILMPRRDLTSDDPTTESGSKLDLDTISSLLGVPVHPRPESADAEDEDRQDSTRKDPVPRRTARHRRRAPAAPTTWQRLKAFFSPGTFFQGVKDELKTVTTKWKENARRHSGDLELEKNSDWWRRTLLEILALFAIVVPIELAVNGGRVGAYGVHPHPYWLIVLPMAGARGVVAGLLSAAVASFLYTFGAFATVGHFDLFTFKIMTEPILFFGVGFFAGELHDELALRHRSLARQLGEVQERNQRLRQQRDVLAEANKLLERRIVDQSVQFGNLVVAATRIENAGRAEVFEIALDLVEEHCGAAASVLLLLSDGSIDFLCHNGWPESEIGARLAAARESAFVHRAVANGVSVNGFSPDEQTPQSGPLSLAPLFDDNGIVKALLCLDEIPASRLNESTLTIFFGIAEWLNAALVRLAKTETRTERRPTAHAGPAGEVFLGESEELGERLRLELERCARYGVPTSFLAIQAPSWSDTSREGSEVLDRFMCIHFTGGLRPSDNIYRFGYPGCYLLVLAGTTVEGAEVVRTRLLRRVEYAPSKQIGRIEIFATGPDTEAPDLVSLSERVAATFRKASPLALDGACPVRVPEETAEGSVDEFLRRLRLETSLATRNGFPLSVVGVAASVPQSADPKLLSRHVRAAGAHALRPTDGVFSIGMNQCVVVLPNTPGTEATTVASRLAEAVHARDPDAPYGDIQTQVLELGENHADVSSFLQALARQGEQE